MLLHPQTPTHSWTQDFNNLGLAKGKHILLRRSRRLGLTAATRLQQKTSRSFPQQDAI